MKNILYINVTNGCECELLSNVNDGSNSVVLNIIADTSKNPRIEIDSASVLITSEDFTYTIDADLYVGDGSITFRIVDDSHTGDYFYIKQVSAVIGNLYLAQKSNFEYELRTMKDSSFSIKVGDTETLPAGEKASVTNSGSDQHLILDFAIPSGAAGATGEKGDDAILLMVDSSNGAIFKNSAIATTLTVNIIIGGERITSSAEMKAKFGENAKVCWKSRQMGEDEFSPIPADDPRLSDEGFIFTLDSGDINTKTVFSCDLDY